MGDEFVELRDILIDEGIFHDACDAVVHPHFSAGLVKTPL